MLTSPCNSGSNPTLRGGYTEHFLRDRERENKPPWGGPPQGPAEAPRLTLLPHGPREAGLPSFPVFKPEHRGTE